MLRKQGIHLGDGELLVGADGNVASGIGEQPFLAFAHQIGTAELHQIVMRSRAS